MPVLKDIWTLITPDIVQGFDDVLFEVFLSNSNRLSIMMISESNSERQFNSYPEMGALRIY